MVNLISDTGIDMKYHLTTSRSPFFQTLVTTSLRPQVPALYLHAPKQTQLPAEDKDMYEDKRADHRA